MFFVTKKRFNKAVAALTSEIDVTREKLEAAVNLNAELIEMQDKSRAEIQLLNKAFPFSLGQTVYDVQLRNVQGKYTKKNPSKEHSLINEVVVDKKNYFKLVDRYAALDVFKTFEEAKQQIDSVCK